MIVIINFLLSFQATLRNNKFTSRLISKEILCIWERSGIPHSQSEPSISRRVLNLYNEWQSINKCPLRKRTLNSHQMKLSLYQKKLPLLFDIALCKCNNLIRCYCPPNDRVPIQEHDFIKDQRSHRIMVIGSIDKQYSKKLIRSLKNKKVSNFNAPKTNCIQPTTAAYQLPREKSCSNDKFKINFKNLAEQCDRYKISDRSAAAIANAFLSDINMVQPINQKLHVDRNIIRRERLRSRQFPPNYQILRALFFDGKKDKTLYRQGNKNSTIIEEHITLLSEPDSKYIGHISPNASNAEAITSSIISFLEENGIGLNHLEAVGCDGTALNVGRKGGILTLLENEIGRPLQRIVCLLHTNELPLRHLFLHIDGTTIGPNSFSGCIGKLLKECDKMPFVNFKKIEFEMDNFESDNLSNDQHYLKEILTCVRSGEVTNYVRNRSPGALNHSRWLTLANRILRTYMSTESPSNNLEILSNYVAKVYGPVWFSIKQKPSIMNASSHFLQLIRRGRFLPDELKHVFDACLSRNCFSIHSENVILNLLCDSSLDVRKQGLAVIKVASESITNKRDYCLPSVNFNANTVLDLLDAKVIWTPPPLLQSLSTNEIEEAIEENSLKSVCQGIPCHSQSVERHVKLISDVAKVVCGFQRRHGMIINTLKCRQK